MTLKQSPDAEWKDDLLTLLADADRRRILTYLRDADDGVATVSDLGSVIDERDRSGSESTRIKLVHSDLPKLEDAGVVEFDQRSETVRYQACPRVEKLLRFVAGM